MCNDAEEEEERIDAYINLLQPGRDINKRVEVHTKYS